jgi:hypothetical protein
MRRARPIFLLFSLSSIIFLSKPTFEHNIIYRFHNTISWVICWKSFSSNIFDTRDWESRNVGGYFHYYEASQSRRYCCIMPQYNFFLQQFTQDYRCVCVCVCVCLSDGSEREVRTFTMAQLLCVCVCYAAARFLLHAPELVGRGIFHTTFTPAGILSCLRICSWYLVGHHQLRCLRWGSW